MSEPRLDWIAGIALSCIYLFPIGTSLASSEWQTRYTELRERLKIKMMPPAWLPGVIYVVMCVLQATAWVLWSRQPLVNQQGALWNWTWILLLVNAAAFKFWSPILFDARGTGMTIPAAIDAVILFATGVVVLILFSLVSPISVVAIVFWSVCLAVQTYVAIMSIWIALANSKYAMLAAEPMHADTFLPNS